jgi:hypothetical protein
MRLNVALGLLAAIGCQEDPGSIAVPAAPVAHHEPFDAASAGTIRGQVVWKDELPRVPAFRVRTYLDYANAVRLRGEYPNPHRPAIDPKTGGIADAVIFLRDVKGAPCKPWTHGPIQVETDSERLTIFQGQQSGRIGFARPGDDVAFVNRDSSFRAVSARGAAFFTLPFIAADQVTRRRLERTGIVNVSEEAGVYWRRAYLFALEHPYAAVSNREGKFALDQVPAGTYELSAWLPNWHVERKERDAETALVRRLIFAPPVELTQTVTIRAGAATDALIEFSMDQFARPSRVALEESAVTNDEIE